MSALTVTCTRLSPIFSWAPAGQVASPKSVAKTLWGWKPSPAIERTFKGPRSRDSPLYRSTVTSENALADRRDHGPLARRVRESSPWRKMRA